MPEEMLLGQFIPLHYHFNMLQDRTRMEPFREAIEMVVPVGGKVLELGGGTGVLSWFAAQRAAKVWCVERNPALARLRVDFSIAMRAANASKSSWPTPCDIYRRNPSMW
ncbi:MAG: hypothetical protein QM811_05070 [Pirellulales bacterium]